VGREVERGEVVAIMGGNGAGKSTLLRAMNGLVPHFYPGEMRGRVLVDGVDTREARVSELARKVGLVFQNPEQMFFCPTVVEEVSFGPKNLGAEGEEVEKAVNQALSEVGLSGYERRSPWSLSGGEMRRLSLAAVLSMRPDYIAVDEPTTGQDAGGKRGLIRLLHRLAREGRGIVVVTHDVEWVVDLSPDRVILMSGGRVVGSGSAEDMLGNSERLVEASLYPPVTARISSRVIGRVVLRPSELADEVLRIAGSA